MCAPRDQRKSRDSQREQAELNALQWAAGRRFGREVISFATPQIARTSTTLLWSHSPLGTERFLPATEADGAECSGVIADTFEASNAFFPTASKAASKVFVTADKPTTLRPPRMF